MASVRRIAIQGEKGSFSHQVAQLIFGREVVLEPCETFADVFAAVCAKKRRADAAVLPIENALFGSIHQNFDLLLRHRPALWREAYLRIELCLFGVSSSAPRPGDRVLVHPVAQGQCGAYLHQKKLVPVTAVDTAGSVREMMQKGDPRLFSVAGPLAGNLYGATLVERGIEDDPLNFTRFLAFGPQASTARRERMSKARRAAKKTSLAFILPNTPGSLFRALAAFSLRDVNLAKLESRPMQGRPFEYLFYLDALGAADDVPVAQAIEHLNQVAERLWVLGSYPRAEAPEGTTAAGSGRRAGGRGKR